mmetsp:Transcript_14952/g.48818  ORF Transcript_14952/g.48818 Transcript_14952/m.48818 type:complete len:162 (+) Transcript_14952:68-553(+)
MILAVFLVFPSIAQALAPSARTSPLRARPSTTQLMAAESSSSSSPSFVPDMAKRKLMNDILLFGGVLPATLAIAVPYLMVFVPPAERGEVGVTSARTKLGEPVQAGAWLKAHAVGDRDLVEGLKSDPFYLIVDDGPKIRDYAINSICTHLGCVRLFIPSPR